jgi:tetratricopeptide (TPR) repeat protein
VRLAAVVFALLVADARAEVVPMPAAPPPDPDRGNFWREMTEPHKEEVTQIVFKARQWLAQADAALMGDYDATGEGRTKIYREVYGMLRYARKLAPDNLDILELYGQAADELGKTRQAMEALHAAIDQVGLDKASIEVTGRLGAIYLRLGQLDDAIRYLRAAQSPIIAGKPMTAMVLVHLSTALALHGQMGDAIDVLVNSLPQNAPYYSNEMQLVSFALAVQYDRDEQRGAAFEVIDRLNGVLPGQVGPLIQNQLATIRFAPAEDESYYLGLLYEVVGNYAEARTEFALYAASGDAPYRRRALDHIATLDADRKSPPKPPPHRPVLLRPIP